MRSRSPSSPVPMQGSARDDFAESRSKEHLGEHAAPPCVSVHVTPLFAGPLATLAVTCTASPACTVAVDGVTETPIAGTVTVTEAGADTLTAEVAVTVTVKLLGGGAWGCVGSSDTAGCRRRETIPHGAVAQATVQLIPLFAVSLVTLAVNWAVVAIST